MFGYDMDVAEYAAIKVKYANIEAVIEYLGKGDEGKYNHKFVKSQSDICYLC